jgi:hypothetical protein
MHRNSDNDKSNRRFRIRARYLILAGVLVLVGLMGLYVRRGQNDLAQRLESLRAAGHPITFAELAEYTRLPEGVPNAADVYALAFDAFKELKDDPNSTIGEIPPTGGSLPEQTVEEMSEYLAATDKCFALLHKAAAIEHCRFDWDYADELRPWIHRRDAKSCAFLLRRRAVFHARAGDADASVTCIQDGLRLADSMQREPGLIGHAMRIALRSCALLSLEQSLNRTAFADQQLTQLDRALAASDATLDLKEAMVTQLCIELERYRSFEYTKRPSFLQSVRDLDLIRPLPGMRARGFVDLLDCWQERVEAAELPITQRLAQFRKIDDDVAGLSFAHTMVKMYGPSTVNRVVELDLLVRAHSNLARAALAVERCRLAMGDVPERLNELVPKYLEQVPIDPFDGKPIRYRRTDPGYLLYSIMADGQDDGGRTRDNVPSGEPYDLCFMVIR